MPKRKYLSFSHYTHVESLKAIFKSGEIRFTKTINQNDIQERKLLESANRVDLYSSSRIIGNTRRNNGFFYKKLALMRMDMTIVRLT